MPGKFINFYSAINPRRVPEESLSLRLSVLASVLAAEITILAMGYYDVLTSVAIPTLTAVGFALSWKRRHNRNLAIKMILSILVILAAVMFMRRLLTSFYDTRLPLIELLLWLQVLHSFDLPARKDLKFSLASGLTLVAAGAVLSTGMLYVAGLVIFSITAVVTLIYFHLSEESMRTENIAPVRPMYVISYAAIVWMVCMLVTVPLLLMMPQTTQAKMHMMPLSSLQKVLADFSDDIVNPGYPQNGGNPFDNPPLFNANSYYGFNPYMDLRSRGNLSDDVILKVRSDSYDYYRGMAFDRYNGKGWEMSSDDTRDIRVDEPPFDLDMPGYPLPSTKMSVQSFYVEGDLPNIIFAAWKPVSLFFPVDHIKVDKYSGIRSPYPLTDGTVYSVVSEKPEYSAGLLRRFPRTNDIEADDEYTSLPASTDMERVASLTRGITDPYDTRYDKVLAIERYLKQNYTYDLGVAPQTEDMDAVAYFLFEEKAGYCEHFSSSMAVMARSIGIPARVVTGYSGGDYNPFTGLWEIRQSNAHAWVEVYFGGAGWAPFDPTPGFDVPTPANQDQGNWVAGRIMSYLGNALGSGPVRSAMSAVGSAAGATVSFTRSLPLVMMGVVALGVIVLAAGMRAMVGRLTLGRRRRRALLESLSPEYLDEAVLANYFRLAERLNEKGLARRPDETLRDFAERVSDYLDTTEFRLLSEMVEKKRYGEAPSPQNTMSLAKKLAESVLEKLGSREGGASTKPS
ncbi:MAG: DUF3488 and transglutaminase-like domain-containing protein [Thermoleophilia bacterium]